MMIPSKTKYRKAFKGRIKCNASNGFVLANGEYGLKALQPYRLNSKQLESARKVIVKSLNKSCKIWLRVFPNIPVSKKPVDVRMGKGKGSVEEWVFKVKPGKILLELGGNISKSDAKLALQKASLKLAMKCKFIALDY